MADIFPTGYFASLNAFSGTTPEEIQKSTVLLFGCGPSLGAEAWNFKEDEEGLRQRVKDLTDGRGADIVIEVVGNSSALRMGFDLLRPWGRISSVGVHNQDIPWTGNETYAKNLRLQMGRCPVRSIFGPGMGLFEKKQDVLNFMSQDIRPLSQAVQA
ncbi:hypothetical protein VN97_g3320 [Penicillium thymicola]|uniref:Alcohol dehydrogenase-like C-terminal domain-containing protein n=1 Tax=Penicillium thymicola TaxID=293382 RepID=A0AAI9XAN0_PENTH|nr:hypothetical protein VN97_g3320 [Penicillium thymicola]